MANKNMNGDKSLGPNGYTMMVLLMVLEGG